MLLFYLAIFNRDFQENENLKSEIIRARTTLVLYRFTVNFEINQRCWRSFALEKWEYSGRVRRWYLFLFSSRGGKRSRSLWVFQCFFLLRLAKLSSFVFCARVTTDDDDSLAKNFKFSQCAMKYEKLLLKLFIYSVDFWSCVISTGDVRWDVRWTFGPLTTKTLAISSFRSSSEID